MKLRPGLELAALSDVGCQRENNEDSYTYWEPEDDGDFDRLGRLAIVADGMGGCEGGHVASEIAVQAICDAYGKGAQPDPQFRLLEAFDEAHSKIQLRAFKTPDLRGMGTTCTALAIVGNSLYFAHVGDSRLYLLREGKLELLTRDDTLVAHLVETGAIRADQADDHPQKHVLTSAVGVAATISPDHSPAPLQLQKSDILLLCTDGLWGQMSDAEMQSASQNLRPADACKALVNLAKQRGGPDNITLQIARVT